MMSALNVAGTVSRTYPALDTLFFKIQGSPNAIKETAEKIKKIATKEHGATHFEFAGSDEEAKVLWQNRKEALWATLSSVEGSRCWTTDVW
jgi:D-lactate dehydrogenase (cytochrome)